MGENPSESIMDKIAKINSSIKILKDIPVPTRDQLKKLSQLHEEKNIIMDDMLLTQQATIGLLKNSLNKIERLNSRPTQELNPKAGGSKRKSDTKNGQTKKNKLDKPENPTLTKNTFAVLENVNETDSRAENNSDMEQEPATDTTANKQTPPPIVLRTKQNFTNITKTIEEKGVKIKSATDKADTIRLHVETCKDFRTTTKFLEDANIPFHTFALKEETLLKVVIKGIPTEISVDEIKADLELQQLPVEKVTRMHRRQNDQQIAIRCVLVLLKRTEAGKKIFEMTSTLHLRVKVENYRARNEISQCYRCQQFGHAARGCRAGPVCNKCAGLHFHYECPKKREDGPATCANCGGEHPSNYRGCPVFPKPEKKQTRTRPPTNSAVVPGTSYASRAGGNATTPVATTSNTDEALQTQTQSNGLNDLLKLITGPKLDKTLKIIKDTMAKISNATAPIDIIKIILDAISELSK